MKESLCTKRAIHNLEVELASFEILSTRQEPICVTSLSKREGSVVIPEVDIKSVLL